MLQILKKNVPLFFYSVFEMTDCYTEIFNRGTDPEFTQS